MPFERVVGLLVADHETYARYRAAIAPLLEAAGAEFRFDLDVARTLKSPDAVEINRLFVLRFPDRAANERFFSDPRYVAIRTALFDPSVRHTEIIAEYSI
jgi:uncharacterized protein (DUF1330 family)